MEYLILTLLGGGILYGLFYLLPLKLNPQLKLVYVIFSVLFANLFLFTKSIFEIWQSALIIILLIFLATYFLTKSKIFAEISRRKSKSIDETTFNDEEEVSEMEASASLQVIELAGADNQVEGIESFIQEQLALQAESNSTNETNPQNQEIETVQTDRVIENEVALVGADVDVSLEAEAGLINEIEPLNEIIEPLIDDLEDRTEAEELISEERVSLVAIEVEKADDEPQFDFLNERKDLFALLEEESIVDGEFSGPVQEDKAEEMPLQVESVRDFELDLEDNSSLELIEETNETDREKAHEQVINEDLLQDLDFTEENEELATASESSVAEKSGDIEALEQGNEIIADEPIVNVHEETTGSDQLLGEQIEGIVPTPFTAEEKSEDQLEDVQTELKTEGMENNESEEDLSISSHDSFVAETTIKAPKQIKRELLDSLVEQLIWYKKRMKSGEYESLIIEHMNDELNDMDYYTFASLLRDYYIERKSYDKLNSLLTKLMHRFDDKPIIKAEISFILEKIIQKQ